MRTPGPTTDAQRYRIAADNGRRDAARPLGLDVCPPPDTWVPVLEFLTSKPATRGFLSKGRLDGLRLVATDTDFAWSVPGRAAAAAISGIIASPGAAEVSGTAEALAMAISGRPVTLPELTGDGVPVLAARLGRMPT